ncbi:PD-(D/E)XK motif protein [Saccharopolyspora sp. NPDC050389]|uniref:PD-(D/E)XK motif protein n=1 Tax=Saccharopolyspora sp. NPDC050389 TaxID=3155516 RepID=UPI0033C744A5
MTERHLSTVGFDEYLRQGVPVEYSIDGKPPMSVFIDPERPAIGIRMPVTEASGLTDSGWRNISLRRIYRGGRREAEIYVDDDRLFLDGYPVLLSITDRMQLDGRPLEEALAITMRVLGQLLQRQETLPVEREIGLFGELLLLEGLCDTLGPTAALKSWLGPTGEEHDFALPTFDLEVKTTAAERRRHDIGSTEQLQPSPERPLLLVSYQLTRTAHGGRTLPDQVRYVREKVEPSERGRFDSLLEQAGLSGPGSGAYPTQWRKRTAGLAFEVGAGFPAITTDALTRAEVDLSRIPNVHYEIDLTGLSSSGAIPDFLTAALSTKDFA